MAGQRPPRAAVRAAVRTCLADLEPGDRLLVALSGGPDSLALTAAAAAVAAEAGLVCEAVVIDHQLQPESGRVAARAAEQARILGCLDATVIAVDVPRGHASGGVEGAARRVRYLALDAMADGDGAPPAVAVLLGHTLDDQAETVLLGLARGSGTRSLAGMAHVAGRYRRPLLDLPREVVTAAAREQAAADMRLQPWVDPHNADRSYARVRVRREVLPVLEGALGPGISRALARTAELARADADALDAWADDLSAAMLAEPDPALRAANPAPDRPSDPVPDPAPPSDVLASSGPCVEYVLQEQHGLEVGTQTDAAPEVTLPGRSARSGSPGAVVARLGPLPRVARPIPPAIVSRVVRRFLISAGCPAGELGAAHVHRTVELLAGGGSPRAEVALPAGLRARREAGVLVVRA